MAAILVHVTSYDSDLCERMGDAIKLALTQADYNEALHPALLLVEPLVLLYDDATTSERRGLSCMQALWQALHSVRDTRPQDYALNDRAFELANAIIRLTVLTPRAVRYYLSDLSCRRVLEDTCRKIAFHADHGVLAQAPPAVHALLNGVTDSILNTAAAASGSAEAALPAVALGAAKPDKFLPSRLYALSLLAGPVHLLPLRDELELQHHTHVTQAERAYIALQRLQRVFAANSFSLTTPLIRLGPPADAPSAASGGGSALPGVA
jgi:hypothetical protein